MMTPPKISPSRSSRQSHEQHDLSFCIVWSPLPPISWLFPFIGHLGICDSAGVASDFRGPYYVGDDGRMAFGAPTRALHIPGVGVVGDDEVESPGVVGSCSTTRISAQEWDDAIRHANEEYSGRMHNICCDNCHSHVAYALNRMNVQAYGVYKWDMVKLALLLFVKGKFLSWTAVLQQFGPLVLLILLILFFK
jgi:hypothetical protein